jgi:CBS domain-containing protein
MSRDQEVTVELRELLSGEVETISGEATVFEGAAAMQRAGVGSLAVVDDDEFTGIFTERDVLRAVASGLITVDAEVADWMTPT